MANVVGMQQHIELAPREPEKGRYLQLRYDGLLAKSGAQQVYVHVGYGKGSWSNISDLAMQRLPDGRWETVFLIPDETDRLNLCFKDNGDNWDNNSGMNWQFDLK